MAVKRNYRINLRNYGNPPAIMVSQYDENYDLVFEVYDGVVPATGLNAYTVKLVGRQPGDDPALKYEFTGTVSGIANNILSFTIDTTMTGRAGKGTAEIVILDATNDVKFASFNLPVYVEKAAVPDDAIDADVERAQEIADEVQDIVDTAAAEVKGEAESWAVGERDGVPVPSTDPTYHNNAKYYAEQAQDIADSIGIDATLSITGKAADAKKTGDEISSLKEDLNYLADYTTTVETPPYVVGTINSVYGTYDQNNQNRIATSIYIPVEKMWFVIPVTYDYNIFFYKGYVETSITNYISATGWKNGNLELGTDISVPSEAKIFKFIVRWHSTPNSPIVPSDFVGYRIIKKAQPTLRTLTPAITFLCRDGMATNDVPPNSVYAIRATANNQYDKIRFSVNKTTDGAYVCVHDTNINNLAVNPDGTPISTTIKTNECTLAELNQYDWGLKYGQQYAGLKVPILSNCVKYATMFNLTIALDIKWSTTVTDEDIEYISGLLAKYGQLQTIFFAIPITTMQKFYAKSKKFSYLFAGTYAQANSQAGTLKLLHSAYNKIYLAYRPMGDKPTDEFINLASVNDFDLMYSPLEGIEAIASLGFDSGSSLLECHYIENIKDSVREYVSTLI